MLSRKLLNSSRIWGRTYVGGGLLGESPSSWLERSRLPEKLAQSAVAFNEDGLAVLDDVLDERDILRLRGQVHELFRTTGAATPNATFVVDSASRQTRLFPKAHILEYDFRSAGPSGFDLLDSTNNDSRFSRMLDAILKPTGANGSGRLAGQNVKVQRNAGSGGCFPIHYDTDGTYDSRKLTCILYLNEAPVEGGDLVLYPYGGPRMCVEPRLNRLAIFRSDTVAHRVLPCFSERYCLTIWCSEPPRDQPVDESGEKEVLHTLVNALHAVTGEKEKRALRQAIEERPLVRKLLTKYALEDEWRQSLIESHDPSTERDALLQSFEGEMERIRSFVRLLDAHPASPT